mmetsp:Transcript_111227/g.227681  ORF Transcript_111227/g.227681 Transcript_111227/m.227681 type:complete len:204 (+) Transcript_111227:403-1014(+)
MQALLLVSVLEDLEVVRALGAHLHCDVVAAAALVPEHLVRDPIVPRAHKEVDRHLLGLTLLAHFRSTCLRSLPRASLGGAGLLIPRRLGFLLGRLPRHKLLLRLLERVLCSCDLLGHFLGLELLQLLPCIPADAAIRLKVLAEQLGAARALACCAGRRHRGLGRGTLDLLHEHCSGPLGLRPRASVLILRHHELLNRFLTRLG